MDVQMIIQWSSDIRFRKSDVFSPIFSWKSKIDFSPQGCNLRPALGNSTKVARHSFCLVPTSYMLKLSFVVSTPIRVAYSFHQLGKVFK